MNPNENPSLPPAPSVVDLAATPSLWPWQDCVRVRFEVGDLAVETAVHSTREPAEQLCRAGADALLEWVQASPGYELDLFERDGQLWAATTYQQRRVEAVVRLGDWVTALYEAILPDVVRDLLSLPLADIELDHDQ